MTIFVSILKANLKKHYAYKKKSLFWKFQSHDNKMHNNTNKQMQLTYRHYEETFLNLIKK